MGGGGGGGVRSTGAMGSWISERRRVKEDGQASESRNGQREQKRAAQGAGSASLANWHLQSRFDAPMGVCGWKKARAPPTLFAKRVMGLCAAGPWIAGGARQRAGAWQQREAPPAGGPLVGLEPPTRSHLLGSMAGLCPC